MSFFCPLNYLRCGQLPMAPCSCDALGRGCCGPRKLCHQAHSRFSTAQADATIRPYAKLASFAHFPIPPRGPVAPYNVNSSVLEDSRLSKRLVSASVFPLVPFAAFAADTDPYSTKVQPFLAKNCYACHNAKLKTADLNLEDLRTHSDDW